MTSIIVRSITKRKYARHKFCSCHNKE